MKITELYIYPIKSLYPLSVRSTRLRPEGLEHDRRFMLLKVLEGGSYKNIQTAYFPECTLFRQTIEKDDNGGESIVVTYSIPAVPLLNPPPPEQRTSLRVPLRPDVTSRETVDVRLFGSATAAYRMGEPYDSWFSACFGYGVILVYIGDQGREVLAHAPNNGEDDISQQKPPQQQQSWFSSITSYITRSDGSQQGEGVRENGNRGKKEKGKRGGWLTFNEAAPFLLTSKASLRDVSARLPEGEVMDMIKFRPNIVVDDDRDSDSSADAPESSSTVLSSSSSSSSSAEDDDPHKTEPPQPLQAWEEDFWAELELRRRGKEEEGGGKKIGDRNRRGARKGRLALTANCARCVSINIDYDTGRPAAGEQGVVLKKLMRDRRVDHGNKWSPIFGRYAFLLPSRPDGTTIRPRPGVGYEAKDDVYDDQESGEDEYDDNDIAVDISVGDEVTVARRVSDRDVWSWPKT